MTKLSRVPGFSYMSLLTRSVPVHYSHFTSYSNDEREISCLENHDNHLKECFLTCLKKLFV